MLLVNVVVGGAYLNGKKGEVIYIAIGHPVLDLCYIDWITGRFDVRRRI